MHILAEKEYKCITNLTNYGLVGFDINMHTDIHEIIITRGIVDVLLLAYLIKFISKQRII